MNGIGISLGNPAGIGGNRGAGAGGAPAIDAVIYGDLALLQRAARQLGMPGPDPDRVRPVTRLRPDEVTAGRPNQASAQAQLAYLVAATDAALAGIRALVTAPISKEWIARAGFDYPGHTEYLAARAGVSEFAMMLAGPALRVVLATTHLALRDVAGTLRVEEMSVGDLPGRARAARSVRPGAPPGSRWPGSTRTPVKPGDSETKSCAWSRQQSWRPAAASRQPASTPR